MADENVKTLSFKQGLITSLPSGDNREEGTLYFARKDNNINEAYLYGFFDGKMYSITSHFLDDANIAGNVTIGANDNIRNLTVHGAAIIDNTLSIANTTTIGTSSSKADLIVNGDVHITGQDLYLGSGTTAATRVQMKYEAGSSGDTLTFIFND